MWGSMMDNSAEWLQDNSQPSFREVCEFTSWTKWTFHPDDRLPALNSSLALKLSICETGFLKQRAAGGLSIPAVPSLAVFNKKNHA